MEDTLIALSAAGFVSSFGGVGRGRDFIGEISLSNLAARAFDASFTGDFSFESPLVRGENLTGDSREVVSSFVISDLEKDFDT